MYYCSIVVLQITTNGISFISSNVTMEIKSCQNHEVSVIILNIERRHTVHQMYAESNVTSCICHGLGICTLTNLSACDVIDRTSCTQCRRKGGASP